MCLSCSDQKQGVDIPSVENNRASKKSKKSTLSNDKNDSIMTKGYSKRGYQYSSSNNLRSEREHDEDSKHSDESSGLTPISSELYETPTAEQIDYEGDAERYKNNGHYEMAIEQYQKAIQKSKLPSPHLLKGIAECFGRLGDYNSALEYTEKLIEEDRDDIESYKTASKCLEKLGRDTLNPDFLDRAIAYMQ